MNEGNVEKPENVFKNIELNRDVKSFWRYASCHKQEKNLRALGFFFFFLFCYRIVASKIAKNLFFQCDSIIIILFLFFVPSLPIILLLYQIFRPLEP